MTDGGRTDGRRVQRGKNVWFHVHSDHVRGNDVAADSVVNYAWLYVTVCTNDLRFTHISAATFLVYVMTVLLSWSV